MDGGGERHSVGASEVETVLPKVGSGSRVAVVGGRHAGAVGALAAIHTERFCVDVLLAGGALACGIEYEDVTKLQA